MKKKVSIGILTYNHENFIAQCLESCLDLKYENLQIIISDDASKDNTVAVIENILSSLTSKHEIIFIKNVQNLGLAGNFNKVFYETADGDFLITLGGDDAIAYDYIQEALDQFETNPKALMMDFNATVIDQNNHVISNHEQLDFSAKSYTLDDYIYLNTVKSFAPARMLKKELLSSFSPISLNCPTEDTVLVLRAVMTGELLRVNKRVVLYRKHLGNISNIKSMKKMSHFKTIAQYIKDALHLYEKDLISEELIKRLFIRFNFEYKRRQLAYSSMPSRMKVLVMRLNKMVYKIQNK